MKMHYITCQSKLTLLKTRAFPDATLVDSIDPPATTGQWLDGRLDSNSSLKLGAVTFGSQSGPK